LGSGKDVFGNEKNHQKISLDRIPVLEDNKVAGLIRLADLFKEISGALLSWDFNNLE
jgi:hypothetical protein